MFYERKEKIIRLFDDYTTIISKAKHGKGLKLITPKQMLKRLPRAFAQVKAGNAPDKLLNEVREII